MKFTSKIVKAAWRIRRNAAINFCCGVMEISWKHCLDLAMASYRKIKKVFVKFEAWGTDGTKIDKVVKIKVSSHFAKYGYPDYENPKTKDEDYVILNKLKRLFKIPISSYKMV